MPGNSAQPQWAGTGRWPRPQAVQEASLQGSSVPPGGSPQPYQRGHVCAGRRAEGAGREPAAPPPRPAGRGEAARYEPPALAVAVAVAVAGAGAERAAGAGAAG